MSEGCHPAQDAPQHAGRGKPVQMNFVLAWFAETCWIGEESNNILINDFLEDEALLYRQLY